MLLMFLFVNLGWSQTAVYTVSTTTAVVSSGTTPSGSSATYAQTFNTAKQITSSNSATLTLNGYGGLRITSIALEMKSNATAGAGTLSVLAGTTSIASISPTQNFSGAAWYGAYSASYVPVNITPTAYTIVSGEALKIVIAATANRLYIQKYTITYESPVLSPVVQTTAATLVSATSSTFNGTVNANGLSATNSFDYGITASYGSTVSATPATLNTSIATAVTADVTSLSVNTQYFYRTVATVAATPTNATGTSFWTLANAPLTPSISNAQVDALSVSLNTTDGNPATTQYAILETTTNKYVQANGSLTTTPVWRIAGASGWNSTVQVIGLSDNTSYTFKVKARNGNSVETAFSNEVSGSTLVNTTPVIVVNSLTDYAATCVNTDAATQTLTISGSNLTTANVQVGPLSGFSFSNDNGLNYAATLNLSADVSGNLSANVLVKFTPTAVQSYNGNIAISGGGATTVNVSVVASGINTVPSVTTPTNTAIAAKSATLGGNITVAGCSSISERGIYYSTVNNFANGDGTKVSEINGPYTTGVFTINVTGLNSNVVYYYKAFTTSASGTSYSTQGTFTTLAISAPLATAATATNSDNFTANWNTVADATGYKLDVYQKALVDTEILNQTFTWASNSTGGNDGSWSGTIATGSVLTADLPSWTYVSVNKGNNCIKVGAGSSQGSVTTPALNFTGSGTMTFRAGAWNGGSEQVKLILEISGGGTLNLNEVTMLKGDFSNYTVQISNATVNSKVTFKGFQASSSRFFLDDVKINAPVENLQYVSGFQNLTVAGNSINVTGLNSNTQYYYVVRAIDATSTSINSNEIAVTTDGPFLWKGTTNNLWSVATNWFGGTQPDGSKDVLINSGTPVLDVNYTVPAGKNLTISAAGTLVVNPTSTLTVAGNADFGGKLITLKSDATGTAAIGQITGTLTGATNVIAERFIPAKRSWRMLTAPLKGNSNNTIPANWQGTPSEGLLLFSPDSYQSQTMTGYTTGGSIPNIWKYNAGWQSIANVTSETLFASNAENTKPFLVFATGSFSSNTVSSGAEATTLRPKGELITGSVSQTALGTGIFHAVANPYASAISPVSLVTNNPGQKLWFLDPSIGNYGGYATYDGADWVPTVPTTNDGNIQSGQGFFIKSATATNFTISESDKIAGSSTNWFEKNATVTTLDNLSKDKIRVLLYKQEASQWKVADGILAVNTASATNAVDDLDASKISNFNESMMFRNTTSNLSIEYRGLPQAGDVQPIRLTGTTAIAYQLRINTENYSNSTLVPFLEDNVAGTLTQIPVDDSVLTVAFSGTVATASNPDNRFKIVYQSVLGNESFVKLNVNVYPNPVKNQQLNIDLNDTNAVAKYTITNLLGQVIQNGELLNKENVITINTSKKGMYLLQVTQEGKVFTTKILNN